MYQFKNILKKLFSKSKKDNQIKYYKSLDDLPFYNWKKIYIEKDLKYLIINYENGIFENIHNLESKLELLWTKIYDEYINDFGFTKKMERILNLERQISIITCDIWIQNNKFLRNKLAILKKQLENEKKNTLDEKGNDYDRQTILIEKWLQSSINIKHTSTRKYFTYLNLIDEESKKYNLKEIKNGKD